MANHEEQSKREDRKQSAMAMAGRMGTLSEAEKEGRWAGVAEWLRTAHSLLDKKAVELTSNSD